MSEMPPSDPVATSPIGRPQDQTSLWRIASYLAGGTIAVYLATWVGPLSFYWCFQKPLLAQEQGPEHSILWYEPTLVAAVDAIALEGWSRQERDGCEFPVPPGKLIDLRWANSTAQIKLEEGEVAVHCGDQNFLTSVFEEHLQSLGVLRAGDAASGPVVLEEIIGASLQDYDECDREHQRQRYAARLISKIALWDLRPVKRVELARSDNSRAVLVEYAAGDVKVIIATDRRTIVVDIPPAAPAAWKASAASWMR